jgi:hypothetical protein
LRAAGNDRDFVGVRGYESRRDIAADRTGTEYTDLHASSLGIAGVDRHRM